MKGFVAVLEREVFERRLLGVVAFVLGGCTERHLIRPYLQPCPQ